MRLGIGIYLLATAAVVGVYFVVSPFLADTIDTVAIWNNVMRPLRAVGIALALLVLWIDVRASSSGDVAGLSVRLAFYATAGLAVLFVRASAVGLGPDSSGRETELFIIYWSVINVVYVPMAAGVGWKLLREHWHQPRTSDPAP